MSGIRQLYKQLIITGTIHVRVNQNGQRISNIGRGKTKTETQHDITVLDITKHKQTQIT
jgi:hypothetical protein